MKATVVVIIGVITMFIVPGASQASEAYDLVKAARADLAKGNYQETIKKITRSLKQTNGGKWTFSASNNFSGEWTYLRGKAYLWLGDYKNAIKDLELSARNGAEYKTSWTFKSNPFPGESQDWLRKYSFYYSDLGQAYLKSRMCEKALKSYSRALAIAHRNLFPRGISEKIDLAVAKIFANENSERSKYARSVGAISYNRAQINRALGSNVEAQQDLQVAEMFKFNKKEAIADEPKCS